jgi:hypothetical protein
MVMNSHMLNTEALEMTFYTDIKLTENGFEMAHEEIPPSPFFIGPVNHRMKFHMYAQVICWQHQLMTS